MLRGITFCVEQVNANGGIDLGNGTKLDMDLLTLDASLINITEPICIDPEEAASGLPAETLVTQQLVETRYLDLVERGVDALMGPFSSLLTANASEAVNGSALFYATAASAASLYNRSISSFYGVLPRTQLYVDNSNVFPILLTRSNGDTPMTFGITFESTDTFGSEVAQAAYNNIIANGGSVTHFVPFNTEAAPGSSVFVSLNEIVKSWMSEKPMIDVFVLGGLPDLFPQIRNIFTQNRIQFNGAVFLGGLGHLELYNFRENLGWINTNLWLPNMPMTVVEPSTQYTGIEAFTTPQAYNTSFVERFNFTPGTDEAIGTAACLLYVMGAELAGSIEQGAVDIAMKELDVTNFYGRNKMEQGPDYFNDNSGKLLNAIQYTIKQVDNTRPTFLDIDNPSTLEYPAVWPWDLPRPDNDDNNNGETAKNLAIIFGVIGAVIILIILSAIAIFYIQRRRFRSKLAAFGKRSRQKPKPGENACVLVSDVMSSTALFEVDAYNMAAAMKQHNAYFRFLLRRHYGFEKCTEGDSFTALFHNCTDALSFASDLQKMFMDIRWPEPLYSTNVMRNDEEIQPAGILYEQDKLLFKGLRVRMGIHYGVVGEADVIAKDICDVTRSGGQVVVSSTAWTEATSSQIPIFERDLSVLDMCGITCWKKEDETANGSTSDRSYRDLIGKYTKGSRWRSHGETTHKHVSKPVTVEMSRSTRQELYVESLGDVHIKQNAPSQTIELLSVLPNSLKERYLHFEPLKVLQVTPPYSAAPCAKLNQDEYIKTTMVFIYVNGIEAMLLTDKKNLAKSTMTTLETGAIDKCAHIYEGYKCEAFDTGFLMAFSNPHNAIAFSIFVHKLSMELDWPQEVLELDDFCTLYVRNQFGTKRFHSGRSNSSASNGNSEISLSSDMDLTLTNTNSKSFIESKLVLRGPRLKIGAYEGIPTECSPHPHTGRATYTGQLVNRAARIASRTPAGHCLVAVDVWHSAKKQFNEGTDDEPHVSNDIGAISLENTIDLPTGSRCLEDVVDIIDITATDLGAFKLKGVNEKIGILHVYDDVLFSRPFPVFDTD